MLRLPRTALAFNSLVGLGMLTGCADMRDTIDRISGSQQPRTMAFACDDHQDFKTQFSTDREQARVDVGDKTYDLDYTGRDNGMRVYSDKDDKFRMSVSSDQACLRMPGGSDYKVASARDRARSAGLSSWTLRAGEPKQPILFEPLTMMARDRKKRIAHA